jgi:hypothetical protein
VVPFADGKQAGAHVMPGNAAPCGMLHNSAISNYGSWGSRGGCSNQQERGPERVVKRRCAQVQWLGEGVLCDAYRRPWQSMHARTLGVGCDGGQATSPPYRSKDSGNMTPGGDDEQQISRMALAVGSRLLGMPPPHTYEEAWQVEQHCALLSARRLASVKLTGGS